MTIRFLLVCDGSSDAALVPHISRLLILNGQDDPLGNAWASSGPLVHKIRDGLRHTGECDLLMVHRDAEASRETRSAGWHTRFAEIEEAVRNSEFEGSWVGLVPVRMTESWLLVDESAIRYVAGRPQSNTPLDLPPLRRVELESDPKARLAAALTIASGTTGRKRKRFIKEIPKLRNQLLEELPIGGSLEQVPSWVRFRDDLLKALASRGSS